MLVVRNAEGRITATVETADDLTTKLLLFAKQVGGTLEEVPYERAIAEIAEVAKADADGEAALAAADGEAALVDAEVGQSGLADEVRAKNPPAKRTKK